MELRIREPAHLEFPEQSTEVAEDLPEFLDEYCSAHVYEETTQGQEKNHLESLVTTVPGAHERFRIISIPTSQSGKTK